MRQELVSVVMATYNRAYTLGRAIRSVLGQTYPRWELIVVDDGSTDGTADLVRSHDDQRLRYVAHVNNRGVTAAKNTGFDHARGEWIITLDSDDEMMGHALETFLGALDRVDSGLDAISSNCLDVRTGRWTGRGLDRDQYLTVPHVLDLCRGEYWGMFHRRILGERRFNERIRGYEGILWNQIHESAKWYYLHQALRIYHTDGLDRVTRLGVDLVHRARRLHEQYAAIFDEEQDYLRRLRGWSRREFCRLNLNAASNFLFLGDGRRLKMAADNLEQAGMPGRARALRWAMLIRRARAISRPDDAAETR